MGVWVHPRLVLWQPVEPVELDGVCARGWGLVSTSSGSTDFGLVQACGDRHVAFVQHVRASIDDSSLNVAVLQETARYCLALWDGTIEGIRLELPSSYLSVILGC